MHVSSGGRDNAMCALAHLYLQTDKRTWLEENKCASQASREGRGGGGLNESFDQEQLQGKVNDEEVEQMKS